ncbi:MAG: hypothetical protein AAFN11_01660 [Chloroflexota bacterium]
MSTANQNQNGTAPKFPVPRNNQQANTTPTPPKSRFGSGSTSRFGSSRFASREEISWTVMPATNTAIRISLEGLGDPLHRLLGHPINVRYSNPHHLTKALADDPELSEKLAVALDEAWEGLNFKGAALLYDWDDRIKKAFIEMPQPLPPKPPKKEDDDASDEDDDSDPLSWLDDIGIAPHQSKQLRAIDVAFVMNILARSRAGVLVGNTPLALEPGFLEGSVICEDPRIVDLARATGCIDEKW